MTLTFQCYKLCFLVAENADYTGDVKILDIGLLPGFPDTVESIYQLNTKEIIQSIYTAQTIFS